MAISGLVIKVGSTAIGAPTGGSDVTFTDDKSAKDGVHTIDASDVNYFTRKSVTYRSRQPKKLADGTIQKAKRVGQLSIPFTKADGTLTQSIVRCELEVDPEITEANIVSYLIAGAQMMTLVGSASFWKTGSMA
jgi:hypothetical protein